MKPANPIPYEPGPPIQPAAALLSWLQSQAAASSERRKRFRLPVVIRFEDSYRLGIASAFIGTSAQDNVSDALRLSLDDTAMSISLLSIVTDLCPKTSDSCAVWLEGFWGSLMDFDLPEFQPLSDAEGEWPFAVLKVGGLVAESETQPVAFVERSSGES
jgi:hypothetical protein